MRNRSALLAVLCLTIGLSGCSTEKNGERVATESVTEEETGTENEASQEIFAMDTYMTVTAYGTEAEEAVEEAIAEIERLDALLSTGSETSEVTKLNQEGGGAMSEEVEYLVERSLELWESSYGVFDIAIYPLMKEWGFADENYHVPTEERLQELLPLTDASQLKYDAQTHSISYEKEGMMIDLGGIAKGYTSTKIMDIFRKHDIVSGLVNLGGNVQVYGAKTDGSNWRVAIQSPTDAGSYLGVLSTKDRAVITSGGYERYFEEDGKTYHHIIDPATGYPAENGLISVTIVSADGTLADGLSTSLFIMGKEKAIAYWQEHQTEFEMILMTEDEKLLVSEGIEKSFSSDDYKIEIIKAK
ncbi:MAG: FAD:protein FMN transferase [Roseburia sp.]